MVLTLSRVSKWGIWGRAAEAGPRLMASTTASSAAATSALCCSLRSITSPAAAPFVRPFSLCLLWSGPGTSAPLHERLPSESHQSRLPMSTPRCVVTIAGREAPGDLSHRNGTPRTSSRMARYPNGSEMETAGHGENASVAGTKRSWMPTGVCHDGVMHGRPPTATTAEARIRRKVRARMMTVAIVTEVT